MKQVTYIFTLLLCVTSSTGYTAAAEPMGDEYGRRCVSPVDSTCMGMDFDQEDSEGKATGFSYTINYEDGRLERHLIPGVLLRSLSTIDFYVPYISDEFDRGRLEEIIIKAATNITNLSKEAEKGADGLSSFFKRLGADIKKGIEEGKVDWETRRVKEQVAKEARRLEAQARKAAEKAKKEAKRIGRKLGWK